MNRSLSRRPPLYLLVLTVAVALLLVRGLHSGGAWKEGKSNDFRAYHLAAQAVWDGDFTPAYDDTLRPYQYPPPFAFLLAPLGGLPYRVAVVFWVIINVVLIVLLFFSIERVLGREFCVASRLAGFLLIYRLLDSDIANGNANSVLLAIVLGAFVIVRKERPGLGGGVLAAACLMKVSPTISVAWMFGRWRMLGGLVLGFVAFGLLIPVLVVGWQPAIEAWGIWCKTTLAAAQPLGDAYHSESGRGYMPGQGLRALVHRLLRDSDATAHDTLVRSVHILDLPKAWADVSYLALGACFVALLVYVSRKRRSSGGFAWGAEEIATACAAMALLGPLSRKAHFVLLWPAAVLGFAAWFHCHAPRSRRLGAALWFLSLVLIVGTSPGVLGRELSTWVQAYCPLAWASGCLLYLVNAPRFVPPDVQVKGAKGAT